MGIGIAMVGAALIGGISAKSSADSAERAQDSANVLTKEGLAIQQQQQDINNNTYTAQMEDYNRMKAIYGPIQEDVGVYFKNLTGETLTNDKLNQIQSASQQAELDIKQNLAQSGRGGSGLEDYLLANNSYTTAMNKATIRATADQQVVEQQLGYLQYAQGTAQQSITNATNASNASQANANTQSQLLQNQGTLGVQTAANTNAIYGNYANQLQGLVGYSARLNDAEGVN